MFQTYFSTRRMLHKEIQGESRVRENRTHGLVGEAKRNKCNVFRDKHLHGFTLIELLVVIAIITLLASIAVPNYFKGLEKSKIGKAQADIVLLRKSVDLFRADKGGDLSEFKGLDALFPEYLSKPVPADPWGGSYSCTVTATSYTITDGSSKVSETITF